MRNHTSAFVRRKYGLSSVWNSFDPALPLITNSGPGGEPVYCPNEKLSVADIVEATRVYTAFSVLALLK